MKSPFKFLDAYTLKDKNVFFGRDEEVATLHRMVNQNRLMLVYGQSGTGKTSLVQCGLAGQFDVTDWYPIFIRRGEDINGSLRQALSKALALDGWPFDSLPEAIEELYANYLRPVYLIFDQLEEVVILGSKAEQEVFIQSIAHILEAALPCRILFILREEYIAGLYDFEKVIPTLFDRRLRVERMSYHNVSQVITRSCAQFHISFQDPDQNVTQIIDSVSSGKAGVQLPYLQMYLDQLWRDDYAQTYGAGSSWEKEGYPPLEFTTREITHLGTIEDVLEQFLRQQTQTIQDQVARTHPALPRDGVRQVLDLFVTEEGTKRPVRYERQEGQIVLEPDMQGKLDHLPAPDILQRLEQARILRFTENQIELAHDSLAELIDRERSTEQRQLNQIRRRLSAAYVEHRETGVFLTPRQLAGIEEYRQRLKLEPPLEQFINDSYAEAERLEQAEEARRQKELQLTRDKLAAEQRDAKRRSMVNRIMGIALVVVGFLGVYAYGQSRKAKLALQRFEESQADKVRTEVNEIVNRASQLYYRNYSNEKDSLLFEAKAILNEFGNKELLQETISEVDELLKKK